MNTQSSLIEANGFGIMRVPDLVPQPKAKYYSRNRDTGAVIEHHLPADAYSMQLYLRKGFVLNVNDLPVWAETKVAKPTLKARKRKIPKEV